MHDCLVAQRLNAQLLTTTLDEQCHQGQYVHCPEDSILSRNLHFIWGLLGEGGANLPFLGGSSHTVDTLGHNSVIIPMSAGCGI